ncbi:hypothetical protein KIL84_009507, partial [Mauremys mutica]
PELEPNAECDKAPKHLQKTFIISNEGSPVAGQSAQTEPPNGTEQQAGNCKESHLKKSGTSQSKEQPQNAKPLEPPSSIRRQSYKQAVDERCNGQQLEDCDHSPSYDKATSSPVSETLASLSPASKVARPFKCVLRTVQKNQLLVTPGSTGHNSVMKNLIKRNTPTRPDSKHRRSGLALPSQEEDEHKQQELLQKRREDEQHDKGRKIAELKKLAEQEQAKER